MYQLYIANKNYSSWSLRPWILMRELAIPFEEQMVPFGHVAEWNAYRKISPTGKVPCLMDGERVVWDSLAIVEYLAEAHEGVWPTDPGARAWARCAAAEMHCGFIALRNQCSMSCGVRIQLNETPPALQQDLARIGALWNEGIHRFGGLFLAGSAFTAVDAFFVPIVFRLQTYALAIDPAPASSYAARLLNLRSMREWYADALKEKWRDTPHEAEILQMGKLMKDLREK